MTTKTGGWQRLSQSTVYENDWIKVTHEDVKRPNGSEGIYGVVNFKTKAVGVVPIDKNGFTYLVKQSRYTLDAYTWEIPEGGCPEGEEPQATALRELEEETGMRARSIEPLCSLHTSNSVTDESAEIFIARDLYPGEQALEDTEDIEVRHLPLAEAVKMAMSGEITDAMSVAALLKIALLENLSQQ